MKKLFASIVISAAFALSAFAAESKEVTLEGTGLCAKCSLKEAEACTSALQVTGSDGKQETYLLTENMKHGEFFCKGSTENLVVKGTVKKEDGKLLLTPTSVEKKQGS